MSCTSQETTQQDVTSEAELDENLIQQLHAVFDSGLDSEELEGVRNILNSHGLALLAQILMVSKYPRAVELHNLAIVIRNHDLSEAAPDALRYNELPCLFASGFCSKIVLLPTSESDSGDAAEVDNALGTEKRCVFMYIQDSNGRHFGVLQIAGCDFVTRFTSQDDATGSLALYQNSGWEAMSPEEIVRRGRLVIE